MKFIIDNAISPVVAELLQKLGYDAIHVRDIGLQSASDSEIFKSAEDQNRVIISADTDFGTLLALWNKPRPSVIFFRHDSDHRPKHQFALLKANLPNITQALETGSIIVIEKKRIRIRSLPIVQDGGPTKISS